MTRFTRVQGKTGVRERERGRKVVAQFLYLFHMYQTIQLAAHGPTDFLPRSYTGSDLCDRSRPDQASEQPQQPVANTSFDVYIYISFPATLLHRIRSSFISPCRSTYNQLLFFTLLLCSCINACIYVGVRYSSVHPCNMAGIVMCAVVACMRVCALRCSNAVQSQFECYVWLNDCESTRKYNEQHWITPLLFFLN